MENKQPTNETHTKDEDSEAIKFAQLDILTQKKFFEIVREHTKEGGIDRKAYNDAIDKFLPSPCWLRL